MALLGTAAALLLVFGGLSWRRARRSTPPPAPNAAAVAPVPSSDTEEAPDTAPVQSDVDAPAPSPPPGLAGPARPGGVVDNVLAQRQLPVRRAYLERLTTLPLSEDERKRVDDELRRIGPASSVALIAHQGVLDATLRVDPRGAKQGVANLRTASKRVAPDFARDLDELADVLETIVAALEAVAQESGEQPVPAGAAQPDHMKIVDRLAQSRDNAGENLRRGCALLAAIHGFRVPTSLEPADSHWLEAAWTALYPEHPQVPKLGPETPPR